MLGSKRVISTLSTKLNDLMLNDELVEFYRVWSLSGGTHSVSEHECLVCLERLVRCYGLQGVANVVIRISWSI